MIEVSVWGGPSYDPFMERFPSLEEACVEYVRRMGDKWWPTWGSDVDGWYVITAENVALILQDVEAVARRAEAAEKAGSR